LKGSGPNVQGVVMIDLEEWAGAEQQFQHALRIAPHNVHADASKNLIVLRNRNDGREG
jgi:hypothetical protein